MSADRLAALVSLARLMRLDPPDAVALATVIENAAQKARMTEAELISACVTNTPLRDYLADACRRVMRLA